jgi:hypothetical protein
VRDVEQNVDEPDPHLQPEEDAYKVNRSGQKGQYKRQWLEKQGSCRRDARY